MKTPTSNKRNQYDLPFEGTKYMDNYGKIWTVKYKPHVSLRYGKCVIAIVFNNESGEGVWDKGNGLIIYRK